MSDRNLGVRIKDLEFTSATSKAKIRRLRQEAHERLEATRRTDLTVLDALAVCKILLQVGIHQDEMWRDVVELSVLPK